MAKYFGLFIVTLFLSSCELIEIEDYISQDELKKSNIILELDGRLPLDENGYYHLVLDSTKNQTLHRISGYVSYTLHPLKVDWNNNLYWWLPANSTVAEITKTYINYFTGEITYVNLPPLKNWKDELVPTINKASYPSDDGEINTMIAPIYKMRKDTMVVKARIGEVDIESTIKIVLD
jgi:hypothetical protein